jgi:hypothetical protein
MPVTIVRFRPVTGTVTTNSGELASYVNGREAIHITLDQAGVGRAP